MLESQGNGVELEACAEKCHQLDSCVSFSVNRNNYCSLNVANDDRSDMAAAESLQCDASFTNDAVHGSGIKCDTGRAEEEDQNNVQRWCYRKISSGNAQCINPCDEGYHYVEFTLPEGITFHVDAKECWDSTPGGEMIDVSSHGHELEGRNAVRGVGARAREFDSHPSNTTIS